MRIIRKNTDVDYEKLKSGYSAGYKDGIAHSKELIRGQAEQIKELQQKLIETTNVASKWKIKYMEMENKLRGEVHELLKRQSKSTKPKDPNNTNIHSSWVSRRYY